MKLLIFSLVMLVGANSFAKELVCSVFSKIEGEQRHQSVNLDSDGNGKIEKEGQKYRFIAEALVVGGNVWSIQLTDRETGYYAGSNYGTSSLLVVLGQPDGNAVLECYVQ